ncbi:glycine-N-acyltransferase-like protein 3 [Natator depressus]|uniref:glycine-N-acyltransferase-like protein 3 n=1 Tax=Natator depressus TaxID=27790 RepID=UPI003EBEFD3D
MTDFYTNMYAAFHQDLVAYQALLGSTGGISWGQAFRIHGPVAAPCKAPGWVYEASRDTAEAKGVQLLDSAMWETSRDESLSNLRNKTWLYVGTEQSWQYLANLIHHFPSFCLLDATDHPVSWSLMDPFGAMAHGYTLPQHPLDNLPMQRLQESQSFQRQPSLCYHYPHPRASDGSQLSVLTQHQPPPPT